MTPPAPTAAARAGCLPPAWKRITSFPSQKAATTRPKIYAGRATNATNSKAQNYLPSIQSQETLSLFFTPNSQSWQDHFRFSEDGSTIVGLTSIGRATILALKMNRPEMIALRLNWQELGWKPA